MKRVLFSHIFSTNEYHNIGDANSCPMSYFPQFNECERVCYTDAFHSCSKDDIIVFGGGGLFMRDWHKLLISLAERGVHIALWGVGMNYEGWTLPGGIGQAFDACKIVGIRDKKLAEALNRTWIPDASCLHPDFPTLRYSEPDCEVVQYCHAWGTLDLPGIPKENNMNRGQSMADVLHFLSRGKFVVTNSYHGAYWSMLLGRNVILWNPSARMVSGLPTLLPSANSAEQVEFLMRYGCFPEENWWLGECQVRNQVMFDLVSRFIKRQIS